MSRAVSRFAISALALAAGVLVLGMPAAHADRSAPVLRFSAIPDQDETRLREKFQPVAAYLSVQLGVPVEYVHATRYSDSVELFKNGDIQLAWFGGLTGVQARHAVPGARAIAQGAEDPDFYSYFIAHVDSGIAPSSEFPAALKGSTFAFGSPGSTSGRLMPESFVRKLGGAAPEDFFESISFSGSHDRTVELVESGQFDAGAVNHQVYDRRVKEGETDPEVARIVWKTPSYPDYNFTAHPALDEDFGPGFTERVQAALLAMTDPDLLSAFPRSALIRASDSDFAVIEELARELAFIR